MPARQPFTVLCRAAGRSPACGRSDLHVHTTFSDGTYTPAQVVELARRCGLAAVAITDHDTLAGIEAGRAAAARTRVELVAGVELTAEYRGHEIHVLGHFVRPEHVPLRTILDLLRELRAARFGEMVERLRHCGLELDGDAIPTGLPGEALGRRHLARLLVETRQVGSIREAFTRYLADGGRAAVPKVRLAVGEAIALVRGAGGVAGWAHPSYDCKEQSLRELRDLGLGAVEAEYPGFRRARTQELRDWAGRLGLAVTGGSDCHGPEPVGRSVGACTISGDELEALRRAVGGRGE